MGLVNAVVPSRELGPAAFELAARLAAGPTAAYAAIKEAIAYSAAHSLASSLERRASCRTRSAPARTTGTRTAAFLRKEQSRSSTVGARARAALDAASASLPASRRRIRADESPGRSARRASSRRGGRRPARTPASTRRPWSGRRTGTARFELLGHRGGLRRGRRHVGERARRRPGRRVGRERPEQPATSPSGRSSTARALAIVASTLARLRTMPASASSRSHVGVVEAGHPLGSKPAKAARNAGRLRRIVSQDSPDWKASRRQPLEQPLVACTGTPHSSSW